MSTWDVFKYSTKPSRNKSRLIVTLKTNSPNITDSWGRTPLYIACANNDREIAELLLQHRANPDIKTQTDCTPLFIACFFGFIDIVLLLLDYTRHSDGALRIAITRSHVAVAEELIRRGVGLEDRDSDGNSPMLLAVSHDHTDLVRLLCRTPGVRCNYNNLVGDTAVHLAVKNVDVLFALLQNKFPVDSRNNNDESPLSLACEIKYRNAIVLLLEHGAGKSDSETALHVAVSQNDMVLIDLLLYYDVNINAKDSSGDTALDDCLEKLNYLLAEYLLSKGALVLKYHPYTAEYYRDNLNLYFRAASRVLQQKFPGPEVLEYMYEMLPQ